MSTTPSDAVTLPSGKRDTSTYDAMRRKELLRLNECIQCRQPKRRHYSRCARCLKQQCKRYAMRRGVGAAE